MSRRVPNQCVDQDVSLPRPRGNAAPVTCAADLSRGQLWLLVELAERNGGHPADRCQTLFGFVPSEADREAIGRRADEHHAEWLPWLRVTHETTAVRKVKVRPFVGNLAGVA